MTAVGVPARTAVLRDRPTRNEILFDVAAGAVFGCYGVLVAGSTSATSSLLVAALGLAIATRRWSPWVMSALAVLASLLQLVSEPAYALDPAYVLLFFTLGAHARLTLRRWGLACAVVAPLVAGVFVAVTWPRSGSTSPQPLLDGAMFAVLTSVVTLGGWVAGFVRWQRQAAVQARIDAMEARRVAEALEQEQERSRIAADMHDVVAHSWAVVAAQADGARYALQVDPDEAERALTVIGDTARTAMTDVRTLLTQLRDRGSTTTPLGFQDELADRMRASGMDLRRRTIGRAPTDRLLTVTAHRLLGEALTNALKHGDLTVPVEVHEDWSDGYRLHVTNARRGAEPEARSRGHGVPGMIERATVAGGHLTAGTDGGRWVVDAEIPGAPS